MPNFSINVARLPTHSFLSTADWPADQQSRFVTAVEGVRSADWFQAGCAQLPKVESDRVALAFAHAALSAIQSRNSL